MAGFGFNAMDARPSRAKGFRFFIAAAAAGLLSSFAVAERSAAESLRVRVIEPLTLTSFAATIESATGDHRFSVELADRDETRRIGLMFRDHLPENHGMLFDFGAPRPAAMWMKNTLIELDMVFIREDGIIHRIERRTEPHSLRPIESGAPVRAALELAGGVTERLGIEPGDRVRHAIFARP